MAATELVKVAKDRAKSHDIDDFMGQIRLDIDDALAFVGEFADDFEKADRYFNGEVDIPVEEGRSGVVSTQVRDTIRSLRPSVMRTLVGNRKIVQYIPTTVVQAPIVEQQEAYVRQLFWQNNGYRVLYDAVDESFKHKMGPVKTYWEPTPVPEYNRFTMMTLDELQFLTEMPDVTVISSEQVDVPTGGDDETEFYDVEIEQVATNGRIVMEALPYGEFFISRGARGVSDARVHGHRRSITVAEAIEMGLEHDNWLDLDDEDPDQTIAAGVKQAQTGTMLNAEDDRGDVLSHRFLFTEAYVRIDLLDVGYEQIYCLCLGGTSYELLEYWRETESPFDLICHEPIPFSAYGKSISDVTEEQQDVLTSVLRGIVDNVHLSNTPRLGGNPSQVNFDDLMNHKFGHPVRFKGSGTTVQVIEVPSQAQSTLPVLQWLEQNAQNQVGVTKAAQGLDPNAMQSTDKDAVRNTIALAQGQVELIVRNIIETGLISIFRKLLRLSIQYRDRIQLVRMRGNVVPVDQMLLDPNLQAMPVVGLGTIPDEMQQAGLQFVLSTQFSLIQNLGMDNPFTSLSQVYNTLEDMTESFGLYNVGKYFNQVTPEVEKQFAQMRAQQQQQAAAAAKGPPGAVPDPAIAAQALIQAETIKSGTEKLKVLAQERSKALELQLKAMEFNANDDLKRDQMAQDRIIKQSTLQVQQQRDQQTAALQGAQMQQDANIAASDQQIQREQAAQRPDALGGAESGAAPAAEPSSGGQAPSGAVPTGGDV